ncbi:MAG: hypothetical protein JWN70_4423 [Planctomycetaceae bacterium]|nr:hypothetical protein [Planctomycetaceae bacterium]
MEYAGDLETHLTVESVPADRIAVLRRFAELQGLKCLHIVLDRGHSVSQPMLTRHGQGVLSSELEVARELADRLREAGFDVTRIKIEAAPLNEDVPQSDGAAASLPANHYFEHHVKLVIEGDADLAGLTRLAERHQARLSRNALRVRDDGRLERFVTQRCWSVGRVTAEQRLNALRWDLNQAGWTILETEAEFVVYDSNLDVDAGWLTVGG